jgi:peptidoglycan/LPS O-acetylase OafA/YrhL
MKISTRIPELDGLRGIGIGLILVYHYLLLAILPAPGSLLWYFQASGRLAWTGVDLFFVLSGFLIGGILLDARESSNYFQVFYMRRFYRIVPLYAACLFIVLVLTRFILPLVSPRIHWVAVERIPSYAYALFIQNFWMAKQNTLGAFGLAVTWSLAIEEQFYLTLPILIRFFATRTRLVLIGIGILAAPMLRILLFHYWPENQWATLSSCRAEPTHCYSECSAHPSCASISTDNGWSRTTGCCKPCWPFLV